MAESRRLPFSDPDEAAAQARQIDALLDDGLDRYFAGRYEEAIHLWTRVLFLDRTHERARGYIERARRSMAELQRKSDELLQTSREMLDRGETEAARRLLKEAVSTSGDDVHTAALRVHLERLERARADAGLPVAEPRQIAVPVGWFGRLGVMPVWALAAAAAGVVVVALIALSLADRQGVDEPPAAPASKAVGLPSLSTSEVALVRARTAMSGGRLAEALRELDRVGLDSPDRAAADQLRIEIQQLLMASVRNAPASTPLDSVRR